MLPCWLLPAACTAFALLSCWAWWRLATPCMFGRHLPANGAATTVSMRCPVIGRAIAQNFMLSAIRGFAFQCFHHGAVCFPCAVVEP